MAFSYPPQLVLNFAFFVTDEHVNDIQSISAYM